MLRFSPNPNLAHLINWFEWENDAFAKARAQDRPVMLFLSAFWCRYCQRMDEEAFSDRENMALLNAYFIAVRSENAKRPDVDARYNLNGWPTLAFFAPNGKVLAAANYLSAEAFKELLLNVYMEYEQRKHNLRLEEQAGSHDLPQPGRSSETLSGAAVLRRITEVILSMADHVNGGYGMGQKFIHAAANDFLLARYGATKDRKYLDHVRLTLERMRSSPIYDQKDGGYFRTTTGADWMQPHREKLLPEQAGLLINCLDLFRLTGKRDHARMAEEIIDYLNEKLLDSSKPAFFGCEDFLRRESQTDSEGFFAIIDDCIYTDANALTIVASLKAAAILHRPDCEKLALNVLEFLWFHSRSEDKGMFHYFDGAPQVSSLLIDQARMGMALVWAFAVTGQAMLLDRATSLADFILARFANPEGGYFDRVRNDESVFGSRLVLPDQNGITASLFTSLADMTKEPKYHNAARWAFHGFSRDLAAYGMETAPLGQALGQFFAH